MSEPHYSIVRHWSPALESGAVDLPIWVQKHLIENNDFFRCPIAHSLASEIDPFRHGGGRRSRGECCVRASVLPVHLLFDPHHSDKVYHRMLRQGLFDLMRTDIRAVVNDDLLAASEEAEIAVGAREIPRVEPALSDDFRRGIRIVPVADPLARRPNQKTSGRLGSGAGIRAREGQPRAAVVIAQDRRGKPEIRDGEDAHGLFL